MGNWFESPYVYLEAIREVEIRIKQTEIISQWYMYISYVYISIITINTYLHKKETNILHSIDLTNQLI